MDIKFDDDILGTVTLKLNVLNNHDLTRAINFLNPLIKEAEVEKSEIEAVYEALNHPIHPISLNEARRRFGYKKVENDLNVEDMDNAHIKRIDELICDLGFDGGGKP